MSNSFDVIIIGSGPGGYVCAIRAAQLGLKTACVEKRATLGGTCLNVGCIPSKALLQSSEEFEKTKHALKDHGVLVDGVKLDLARMQARKTEVVNANTKGVEFLFRKNKVTWLKGTGRITGPGSVDVDGTSYTTKNIVIATGSESVPLPGVTVDDERSSPPPAGSNWTKCPAKWWWLAPATSAWNSAASGAAWVRRSPWWNSSTALSPNRLQDNTAFQARAEAGDKIPAGHQSDRRQSRQRWRRPDDGAS